MTEAWTLMKESELLSIQTMHTIKKKVDVDNTGNKNGERSDSRRQGLMLESPIVRSRGETGLRKQNLINISGSNKV